jgi:phage shock protein E
MLNFFSSLAGPARLEVSEARKLIAAGARLLDVRTPAEFAGGHLKGAVNIPVQELAGRLGELDKSETVLVYCASGGRSASAARLLGSAGFGKVHDLGGMSRMV